MHQHESVENAFTSGTTANYSLSVYNGAKAFRPSTAPVANPEWLKKYEIKKKEGLAPVPEEGQPPPAEA